MGGIADMLIAHQRAVITGLREQLTQANERTDTNLRALNRISPLLAEANARLAGKWISVEERLPEIGIPLLFTTNESAIELGMRCFDDGTQIFQCERTGPRDEPITFRVKDGQVTHWQPLPAPPAAKE